MDRTTFDSARRFVTTSLGDVAYVEFGTGPVAVFCHAAVLNGYQWRDVMERCAGTRRVVALDHLGHGYTRPAPGVPVDFAAHARMIGELVDHLGVDRVDLVGSDSGGAIAQMFATTHPTRVRSLTLTNCDARDSTPPLSLMPLLELARSGGVAAMWSFMLDNVEVARGPEVLGALYKHPEALTAETVEAYLEPVAAAPATVAALERFLLGLAFDQIAVIEPQLRTLEIPTLVAWGTADTTFDLEDAHWLANTIPGARPVVEIDGGKLFWPEEEPDLLAELLVDHWSRAA
jgi:pimeloyl-ACP methyl ester carboxylesterase